MLLLGEANTLLSSPFLFQSALNITKFALCWPKVDFFFRFLLISCVISCTLKSHTLSRIPFPMKSSQSSIQRPESPTYLFPWVSIPSSFYFSHMNLSGMSPSHLPSPPLFLLRKQPSFLSLLDLGNQKLNNLKVGRWSEILLKREVWKDLVTSLL